MNFYDQVYAVVRLIPAGKVTSYGRIARMLGRNRAARAVGYALNALKDSPDKDEVPWWRVINAAGRISTVNRELSANKQADRLREEGIEVSEELIIPLEKFLWEGPSLFMLDEIIEQNS
ncbi:MAG: MGMT family protein [Chloroflexota bacterium]